MKKLQGAAVAVATAALLGLSGQGLAAEATIEGPVVANADDTPSLLVVNNHVASVTVYVVDSKGEAHRLGRLDRSGVGSYELPEGVIDFEGAVEVKIYPDAPQPGLGTSTAAPDGIKTRLPVAEGGSFVFWLEPELTNSFTENVEG